MSNLSHSLSTFSPLLSLILTPGQHCTPTFQLLNNLASKNITPNSRTYLSTQSCRLFPPLQLKLTPKRSTLAVNKTNQIYSQMFRYSHIYYHDVTTPKRHQTIYIPESTPPDATPILSTVSPIPTCQKTTCAPQTPSGDPTVNWHGCAHFACSSCAKPFTIQSYYQDRDGLYITNFNSHKSCRRHHTVRFTN